MSHIAGLWTSVDAACEEIMPAAPASVLLAVARCDELGLLPINVSPMMRR